MESKQPTSSAACMKKDVTETEKHFKMRQGTFERAQAAGVPEERAIVLSQIFKNAYFMGCSYPDSVMDESKKYWPKEALANPLYAPLE